MTNPPAGVRPTAAGAVIHSVMSIKMSEVTARRPERFIARFEAGTFESTDTIPALFMGIDLLHKLPIKCASQRCAGRRILQRTQAPTKRAWRVGRALRLQCWIRFIDKITELIDPSAQSTATGGHVATARKRPEELLQPSRVNLALGIWETPEDRVLLRLAVSKPQRHSR